jgi:type II secretory pathway component GspD/PulD (secretin)
VPFLKDIPVLGHLFGSTRRGRFSTELFLFITPRVIRTDDDVDRIRDGIERNTEYLENSLRSVKPLLPADTIKKP